MTQADLERRIHALEEKIVHLEQALVEHDRSLAVLGTGITIARWLGPFVVSLATVIIVLAKGG
jgi:hypothetical protein